MIETKNAIIKKASIEIDRGILTAWLQLDYGGIVQGFGGYVLYSDDKANLAGHFIYRCLQIADVEKWNDLNGKSIRAVTDATGVHKIGHITRDIWFDPKQELNELGN